MPMVLLEMRWILPFMKNGPPTLNLMTSSASNRLASVLLRPTDLGRFTVFNFIPRNGVRNSDRAIIVGWLAPERPVSFPFGIAIGVLVAVNPPPRMK